ncbi:cysteine protease [Mycobacterium phage Funsized]|nr:cysteine protease [Mycobacterium phage Funsized]
MTPGTGRIRHHDPRSRAYAAPRRAVVRKSWLHKLGPVLDQGQVNGCTGWTGADFLNAAIAIGNRRRYNARQPNPRYSSYLTDRDGLALYQAATRNDTLGWTYPPTDNGSTGLGVLKTLKSLGVIDQYLWTFDFDQLLAWGAKQPVMLGTLWTDAMSDPDSRGVIRIGSAAQVRSAEDSGMGHEYLLRGVNWPGKYATIRNHWTKDWGINGDARIPLGDLEQLVLAYKGDVAVPEVA